MKHEPNATPATSTSCPVSDSGSDGAGTQVAEEHFRLTVKNLAGTDLEVSIDSRSFTLQADTEHSVVLANGHHDIEVAKGDYSVYTGFTLDKDDVISIKSVYGQLILT